MLLSLFFFTTADGQSYSGRAATARAKINLNGNPGLEVAIAETSALPATGGSVSALSAGPSILNNVLTAGSSTSGSTGSGNTAQSNASINSINISALSNAVTANVVSSTATASCPSMSTTGSTTITNLRLNGNLVTVTGAANQRVVVSVLGSPVGELVINEQIASPGSIIVNALRLTVTDPLSLTETTVAVAQSYAAINCVATPVAHQFRGSGFGAGVNQGSATIPNLSTYAANNAPLPSVGGSESSSLLGVDILSGLVTAGTVTSSASAGTPGGTPTSSQASSTVEDLDISVLALINVQADAVNAETFCQCGQNGPQCSSDFDILNLNASALGLNIPINLNLPTLSIPIDLGLIGGAHLYIKETVNDGSKITANAVRLRVAVLPSVLVNTEVTVASAHSGVQCGFVPTSGNSNISGQVIDHNGVGIYGATVTLNAANGEILSGRTNPFGYYMLEGATAGNSYVMTVEHRRHQFAPQVVNVGGNISGLDIFPINQDPIRKKPKDE